MTPDRILPTCISEIKNRTMPVSCVSCLGHRRDILTLIDHIYTHFDEIISRVHVCKIAISDHYAVFGNHKLNKYIQTNTYQTITYRSVKNFDENMFINDLREVP